MNQATKRPATAARAGATADPVTARGQATRRRLLAAAEEVFGDKGFERASIVDVTRGAGVAQGTFYVYFSDKRAIFSEPSQPLPHRAAGGFVDEKLHRGYYRRLAAGYVGGARPAGARHRRDDGVHPPRHGRESTCSH